MAEDLHDEKDANDEFPPGLTWETIRAKLSELAIERGEWSGYPLPLPDLPLTVDSRHPVQSLQGFSLDDHAPEEATAQQVAEALAEEIELVNCWYSYTKQALIHVLRRKSNGKSRAFVERIAGQQRLNYQMMTMTAVHVWSAEGEATAMKTLQSLVTDRAFQCYFFTGQFLETSPRSQVTYLFRRLRPTVAIRPTPSDDMRVLCCLCLHPVGYYQGSFAGALCPTDDIIAHLLMMRGDEHKFWACANQHPVWCAEAGL